MINYYIRKLAEALEKEEQDIKYLEEISKVDCEDDTIGYLNSLS